MELEILTEKISAPLISPPNHPEVNFHYITSNKDAEYLCEYLLDKPAQNLDTETDGLNPFVNHVTLVQIGDEERQFLLDPHYVDLETIRPWYESEENKKVGHNVIFDYIMIGADFNMFAEAMRCTFLAETVLTIGAQLGGKSLAAVVKKYLAKELEKEERNSFIGHPRGKPFTDAQKIYAAYDAVYPIRTLQRQSSELLKLGLGPTFVLESNALPSFGDMRLNGMLLDRDLWKKTTASNLEAQEKHLSAMKEMAEPYCDSDLWGEPNINFDSQPEVLRLLQRMGVKVKEFNSRTKEFEEVLIKNTNKGTQKKIMHLPFIKELSGYRKYTKLLNTYGDNFYDCINPVTGRLHPEVKQIGTDTGRPSAGEDDDSSDTFLVVAKKLKRSKDRIPSINPLNIPGKKEYRHAFLARPGYVIETDDYSGCEMRILGEISLDPKLLYIFDNDLDPHCFAASELYGVEVTKDNEYSYHRKPAKALNFGIAYGMEVQKLFNDLTADGVDITIEEAAELHRKYCQVIFPTAVSFLRNSGDLACKQGYLVNLAGRRRYWNLPDPSRIDLYPNGAFDKKYKALMAAIKRQGGNFVIQSVNADITKLAMTNIRAFIKKEKVRSNLYNSVYDEIVTETHKDDSKWFWPEKQRIMREAAEVWLKRVPMVVDGHVLPYWTK